MNTEQSYSGRCFCGAVELTVSGEPAAMGYCHCASCRHWSAGPVNAFTLWNPEAVKVTRGAEYVGSYNKTPASCCKWCKLCGGHLFTEHPDIGLIDVYAAVLEDLEFKPGIHAHYRETVLGMMDGLPKFRDLPMAAGGSGVSIAE